MEFLATDVSEASPPSDEELKTYFQNNEPRFASNTKLSFEHLYFSRERRGETTVEEAKQVLADLAGSQVATIATVAKSDAFIGPSNMNLASATEISRHFGDEFVQGLLALDVGEWMGPIESSYGIHIVRVNERVPGQVPDFESVRDAVLLEWVYQQEREVQERFLGELRAQYDVSVDWAADSTGDEKGTR